MRYISVSGTIIHYRSHTALQPFGAIKPLGTNILEAF